MEPNSLVSVHINRTFLIRCAVLLVAFYCCKMYGEARYKAGMRDMANYIMKHQDDKTDSDEDTLHGSTK